jgi:hypothetical protein
MNSRAILWNGRTVKENGGGTVCIRLFFTNLYTNLVLNLFSVIVIETMLIFLLENDEHLRMECFGSLQTKQLFTRLVEYKKTLI